MRTGLAVGLLAFATVAHAVGYLFAAPEHVVDPEWPLHARFHILQALLWGVGFDAMILVIVLGPFRAGARWARHLLVLAIPFLHGAYFIAIAAIPDGKPPEMWAHVLLGIVAAMYVLGLGLGWRPVAET